ncbi:MAG TPA: hypothetical protein VEP49_20515 [Acidimicrobiia bacterium]|nr:hypothetical protein [Acidimicrobiia bacterium]
MAVTWRRMAPILAVALFAVVGALLVFALSARGSAQPSCAAQMRTLTTYLAHVDVVQGKGADIIHASLADCSSPDAWRKQADDAELTTQLARILHDPGLETDRALDTLCTNFDAYTTTSSCKNHLTE